MLSISSANRSAARCRLSSQDMRATAFEFSGRLGLATSSACAGLPRPSLSRTSIAPTRARWITPTDSAVTAKSGAARNRHLVVKHRAREKPDASDPTWRTLNLRI